jgi:hypothetical protein
MRPAPPRAKATRRYRKRRAVGQLERPRAEFKGPEPRRSPVVSDQRPRETDAMDLLTPLETLCRLILRAKELEAQVPASDPDEDPDDVDDFDDEGGETLSVLEDELNESVEEEVQALLDEFADDQLAETVALAWVGRGTYDASEWDEAFAEASELSADERMDELTEMPLLAGYLEAGLAAFDYSCDGVGQMD